MKLPRDIDIRSGAFVLFAYVVVVTFTGFIVTTTVCRITTTCAASSVGLIETVRSLVENIIAILLALMAGARPAALPPPTEK
jgi:hypothetical protein